jgi:rhamnopyranosyl-N-acetylglucosaminyl-diphospho-decaprenol beta-1,3/1,4-galactofuranosyltransferase
MRICAVIVTYNRPLLLERCVAAVLGQTKKPETVLVVDNCSQIAAKEVLKKYADEVQVFRFSENTGGAGGFCFGLAEAFRQGFDAAWLMDDDGRPSDDCLASLIEATGKAGLAFSNPLVIDERDSDKLVFGIGVSGRVLRSSQEAIACADPHGIIKDTLNPFNGSLITRGCYERLGDIKFECFIWGDEEEYVERARASNLLIGTVTGAKFYHPRAMGSTVRFGPTKIELKLCPPERSHFYFRNYGFSKMRYRGFLGAGYHGVSYLLLLLKLRQLSEAFKFLLYYLDGVFNLYLLRPSRTSLARMLSQVGKV